jgi:DNA ligase-1
MKLFLYESLYHENYTHANSKDEMRAEGLSKGNLLVNASKMAKSIKDKNKILGRLEAVYDTWGAEAALPFAQQAAALWPNSEISKAYEDALARKSEFFYPHPIARIVHNIMQEVLLKGSSAVVAPTKPAAVVKPAVATPEPEPAKLVIGEKAPYPMLAIKNYEGIQLPPKVFVQPKLDGVRCVANTKTGELWSRNGKVILGVPHINQAVLDLNFSSHTPWLDGELYIHGVGFQTIVGMVKRSKNIKVGNPIQYHIYDTIKSGDFKSRNAIVSKIPKSKSLVVVETYEIPKEDINEYQLKFVKEGYEGTMVRFNSPYEINRRSKGLIKVKDFIDTEYKIVDVLKEPNKDVAGVVTLITNEGQKFNARPAMNDAERKDLWDNRAEYIGQLGTVKYQNLTDSGIPRFPNLVGVRYEND